MSSQNDSAKADPRFYELRNALVEDRDNALRRLKADRSLLDVRNGIGESLLNWFVVEGHEDIVLALVEIGVKVDPTNNFGRTPFAEAATLGNHRMCRLLLDHGASVNPLDQNQETPIMSAASMGMTTTCRFLLESGASAVFVSPDGDSALSAAVHSGKIETVEVILSHLPPGTDVNALLGDGDVCMLESTGSDITCLLRRHGLRSMDGDW